ncbi:gamma-butyrobetaine hydroxylase-like domain-containing protein [Paraherbaspirillum soli]|uniref:Gamma-butyrobetaine hydroxylase-like domain-containing protein n=1 Tax=Paraherbaspirillum soli TaxID=631222 RepID=A0ABW0M3Z0_9BURK
MLGSKQSAPAPTPVSFTVHQQSRTLEVAFDDGAVFSLPFELLRVYSPSAEVRGHGQGQETLQTGKRNVGLTALDPVGNYAVKPTFSDGHNSGIYTWAYLYQLGRDQVAMWEDYLRRLDDAGHGRDAGRDLSMTAKTAGGHGCA